MNEYEPIQNSSNLGDEYSNSTSLRNNTNNYQSSTSTSYDTYESESDIGLHNDFLGSDLNNEEHQAYDLVLTMRDVDVRNNNFHMRMYDIFLIWCDFCGVSAASASFSSLLNSISSSLGFTHVDPSDKSMHILPLTRFSYRLLLWISLFYLSAIDIYIGVNQTVGMWIRVMVVILMFIACASSLLLGNAIISSGVITTRMAQNMALTNNPHKYRQQCWSRIALVLFFSMIMTGIGVTADIYDSVNMLSDQSTALLTIIGPIGVYLYRIASVFVHMQSTVGVAVVALYLLVLRDRIMMTHAAMAFDEDMPTETALRRLIDMDITLSHASHKYTTHTVLILFGYMLKFFLCALYHVTENAGDRIANHGDLALAKIIDMVIHPGVVCLFLLIMIGSLNQQVEYTVKICARFTLRQRTKPKHDKKLVRELQVYSKNGDFYFRMYGFLFTLGSVWKLVAVAVSAYILLLRLKRWQII